MHSRPIHTEKNEKFLCCLSIISSFLLVASSFLLLHPLSLSLGVNSPLHWRKAMQKWDLSYMVSLSMHSMCGSYWEVVMTKENILAFYFCSWTRVSFKNLCSVAQLDYQCTNPDSQRAIFTSPALKWHDSNSDSVLVSSKIIKQSSLEPCQNGNYCDRSC